MKIFYGLAVALFFLDGIMIQCNGANEFEITPYLPDEIIGEILAKAGLQKTKEVAQAQMKVAGYAIRRIFETNIIMIWDLAYDVWPQMVEIDQGGEKHVMIWSYTKLMSLFKQFGSNAKRIHICYDSMVKQWRHEINENIIKRCADQLTELLIYARDDTGIWEEISNNQRDVSFPNVEKFSWIGSINRKKLDFNAIFPRLKSFTLLGFVADKNFLANVSNLNELNLSIGSFQEHEVEKIFRKNQEISKLTLSRDPSDTIKKETLRTIEHLKNLETLNFGTVSSDFFNRASDRVYNLTSVTSFRAKFVALIKSNGNLSFDMPKVKHLQLYGMHIDKHMSDIINHFRSLKTVLLNTVDDFNVIECIEQLKYVEIFITANFVTSQFPTLKQFFEKFDMSKSKLRKLVFVMREDYTFYERAMHATNNKLRSSNKPTWTISRNRNQRNYMIFERNE